MSKEDLIAIAARFTRPGPVQDIRELGKGNIHQTFVVTTSGAPGQQFVLQRVNTQVFRNPERVMANMRTVTQHIREQLQSRRPHRTPPWRVAGVIPAEDGRDYWLAEDGGFWRAMEFIDGTRPLDVLDNVADGREAGFALGTFHALLSDLPPERLADTLPGFHITPLYIEHYDRILSVCRLPDTAETRYARQFIEARRTRAGVLEEGRSGGKLVSRPIHGDPKCDNILLDEVTRKAVSMVDLDTVKPGLLHYDIGDCLRSGCNLRGEEIRAWQRTRFDTDMARAILEGYISETRPFLTGHDFEYLYDAIRLIPFELGLRFFTDYLEGNVYFKTTIPEQNLLRALVQFRLAESIEGQERIMRTLIRELK